MAPNNLKRRRSQVFENEQSSPSRDPQRSTSGDVQDANNLEHKQDVWEAFREEHHEAVEQLPLSLRRQFILLRELDGQAHGYCSELLKHLQKYFLLRNSMQAGSYSEWSNTLECSVALNDSGAAPLERAPGSNSSRSLLSQVAWLCEEIQRTSEEKVSLAQACYDSVDRHIRLLDQAIREQETSIVLGLRSGTQPAPIVLPDIVVPKWARPSRAAVSPLPSPERDQIEGYAREALGADTRPTIGIVSQDSTQRPYRKGKKGNAKSQKKQSELIRGAPEPSRRFPSSLKFTAPPPAPLDLVIDPSEPRYCYCNGVSFGEMIACDNKRCKREWFHLSCAGLTEAPKASQKWFCRTCRAKPPWRTV